MTVYILFFYLPGAFLHSARLHGQRLLHLILNRNGILELGLNLSFFFLCRPPSGECKLFPSLSYLSRSSSGQTLLPSSFHLLLYCAIPLASSFHFFLQKVKVLRRNKLFTYVQENGGILPLVVGLLKTSLFPS